MEDFEKLDKNSAEVLGKIGKEDFKMVAEKSIAEKSSVFANLKFAKEEKENEKETEEK